MGLLYIKTWSPVLIPLLSVFNGFLAIFGFIHLGEIITKNIKLEIYKYWYTIINLILGIFTFSLFIQFIAIIRLNNKFSLSILFIFLFLLSLKRLFKTKFSLPQIKKSSLIPIIILITILLIRILIASIPITKIDELHYQMLLPLRLVNEPGLNYFNLPWESAIWPNMHYQFIGAPFYAIGLPDSINVISIGLFIIFLKTLFELINHKINNQELSLWCLIFISTGLHSLVDLPTNASSSLLLVSGTFSLLILCDPEKYLPSKNVKSFSLVYGLFSLSLIGSKILMIPVLFIQIFIFLRKVKTNYGYKLIRKSLFYFFIPLLIFYFPIVTYTWIKSGSPFGPLLASLFINKPDLDPLIRASTGEIGNYSGLYNFGFLAILKWSPFIWISWLFIFNKKIKLETRIIALIILIIQSLLIWYILPDKPRHYGGLQYVGTLIVFIDLIPHFFKKFRRIFLSIFLFSSIPWLFLDFHYSYPLLSKAFLKTEQFKKDYIPFYEDFLILDRILEKDSQIWVIDRRINSFHSPRKIFYKKKTFILNNEIKNEGRATYIFTVGEEQAKSFNFLQLIYSNSQANQFCFRVPNKKCRKNSISVYKI